MEAVLEVVRDSISTQGVSAALQVNDKRSPQPMQEERLFLEEEDLNWDYQEEQTLDDAGEGAGIEGDLEAEED